LASLVPRKRFASVNKVKEKKRESKSLFLQEKIARLQRQRQIFKITASPKHCVRRKKRREKKSSKHLVDRAR